MVSANKKTVTRSGFYMMMVVLTLVLAACAAPAAKSPGNAAAGNTPEPVTEVEIVDDFEGDGMELPLDGTSPESFEASLQRVKRHTTEDNYVTLRKAINYLLVYDLAAKRDMTILVSRLNGLNGYEVIAKVGWRKPPPGKSSIEKGAADGKIIDT